MYTKNVFILASILTVLACGGGGAQVAQSEPLQGNWSGTFTIQAYVDGAVSGAPVSGSMNGAISSNRSTQINMIYSSIPVLLQDTLKGVIGSTGRIDGGEYLMWTSTGSSAQSPTVHNSSFALVGGTLNGSFEVMPLPGTDGRKSWKGTFTATKI